MSLYGRSDVMSVAVSPEHGGCGAVHSRPVKAGVAADLWDLEKTCIICSGSLRKNHDPLWVAMPADIPETPDEKAIREDAEKRGERTLKKAQEELSVRQHELTEKIVALLEQKNGTTAPSGEDISVIVAREVSKALAAVREPEPATLDDVLQKVWTREPLERLHVRTLGKMCRDRGLDDKGGKGDLIARLHPVM